MSEIISLIFYRLTGISFYLILVFPNAIQSAIFTAYEFKDRVNQPRQKPCDEFSKKLICFYTFTNDFKPIALDGLCTHINVGFFTISDENFTLDTEPENLEQLSDTIALKETNKNLKVIISVGGAGVETFSLMTKNHTTRKMFIKSAIKLIQETQADGIDIDWEWPAINGDDREKVRFVQLLHELRVEFNRHKKKYILSVDVSASRPIIEISYFSQYIVNEVDYVNVMCYDYHFYSSLLPLTGHNAPLYYSLSSLLEEGNTDDSIQFWICKQMPRNKIVLGLPTYGHSFTLAFPDKHDLNAPAKGYGSLGIKGVVSYRDICGFLCNKNTTVIYDKKSKVPYAYRFPEWVSFDNEVSLSMKVNYALEQKLAGVMVFAVNTDDYIGDCSKDRKPFPLIRKIKSTLCNFGDVEV